MILSSRCGCHGCEFGHGYHDEGHSNRDHQSQPDGTGKTSICEREDACCEGELPGQAQNNDISDNREESESTLEFLLLAKLGKKRSLANVARWQCSMRGGNYPSHVPIIFCPERFSTNAMKLLVHHADSPDDGSYCLPSTCCCRSLSVSTSCELILCPFENSPIWKLDIVKESSCVL